MNELEAVILGIIEGLTEFLPVSSTGHMILASALMGFHDDEFVKTFEVAIQFGAILSVLTLYYRRFFVGPEIYVKLFIAFLPAAVIGFTVYRIIKEYLFNPIVVSAALIIGGVVLILLDKWTEKKESNYQRVEDISIKGAIQIGFFQCLAMIPGVSRSAASIFGGIYAGFDRRQSAEFSFLLAIPTMFAATGYDLYKSGFDFTQHQWLLLGIGLVTAFITAIIAIKAFIAILIRYGFKHFGYYRIIIGVLFLIFAMYYGLDVTHD